MINAKQKEEISLYFYKFKLSFVSSVVGEIYPPYDAKMVRKCPAKQLLMGHSSTTYIHIPYIHTRHSHNTQFRMNYTLKEASCRDSLAFREHAHSLELPKTL